MRTFQPSGRSGDPLMRWSVVEVRVLHRVLSGRFFCPSAATPKTTPERILALLKSIPKALCRYLYQIKI